MASARNQLVTPASIEHDQVKLFCVGSCPVLNLAPVCVTRSVGSVFNLVEAGSIGYYDFLLRFKNARDIILCDEISIFLNPFPTDTYLHFLFEFRAF